jgi:diacylglycerol kinase family enzyme/membrane-associated phospholipid phosphatase
MRSRPLRRLLVIQRRRQVLPPAVRRMDRHAAHAINRRHAHPAIDRGLRELSHSANHGVLWFVIAGVLFLLGRRSRHAAVRGVASLGVASVLANLVGKKIFGGERPLLDGVIAGRRLGRQPTSPSFPSGHSASAAAFVAGVALESPAVGAALAPVAGAVAYSRLHSGAHWLSDVLGGIAMGAIVAGLGRLLVPARPRTERDAQPATSAVAELPALIDGTGALILVNPASGPRSAHERILSALRERLPGADVRELRAGDRMSHIVRSAVASDQPPRVLGICGGDGSIATAAHLARAADLPLMVIPGGTYNHFAGTAGIDSVDLAIDLLQRGEGGKVDVAELGFRGGEPITVLNTASVGLYPGFVTEREKREKRLGKRVAALIAAAGVLAAADPIEVTIDGRRRRVWSVFVGVNRYRSSAAAPLRRRRLDDGVLDVRILNAGEPRARSRGLFALGFGRPSSLVHSLTTDALAVSVHARHGHDPGFAHDGEASLHTPGGRGRDGSFESELRIVPGGLTIYCPVNAGEQH